jgi:exodeoxyribonuclease VII small subunit
LNQTTLVFFIHTDVQLILFELRLSKNAIQDLYKMGTPEKQSVAQKELSFEQALANLEEIIQRMESGEAPLDSLITNYQTGVKMLKLCREKLESAEMNIKEVQEKDKELIKKDFEDMV